MNAPEDTSYRLSVIRSPSSSFHRANDIKVTYMDLSQIQTSGYATPNEVESAIAIALSPGNYTAILSGKNSATGNALIEVYALN